MHMFHHKQTIDAETIGFRLKADLFKSPQIIQGFGCHGQCWNVSHLENGTTFKRFAVRKWLLQKPLVSDSKQTSSNQNRLCQAFVVMDNIETFHNKNVVAVETVGFRFKADLFKSVLIIVCFWCHWLHWDVSPQENGCCRNRWFHIRSTSNEFRWS